MKFNELNLLLEAKEYGHYNLIDGWVETYEYYYHDIADEQEQAILRGENTSRTDTRLAWGNVETQALEVNKDSGFFHDYVTEWFDDVKILKMVVKYFKHPYKLKNPTLFKRLVDATTLYLNTCLECGESTSLSQRGAVCLSCPNITSIDLMLVETVVEMIFQQGWDRDDSNDWAEQYLLYHSGIDKYMNDEMKKMRARILLPPDSHHRRH